MMRNNPPDPDMERRLRDHFADEAEDLRAPDDLWDRLESRLGEQDPPRFALLRGGMAWLQGWTVERPGMATAAAAVLVLAIGITTWSLMGGDGVGDDEPDYDVAATSATTSMTTTTAASITQESSTTTTTASASDAVSDDADDASSAPALTPLATATPASVAPATVVAGQAGEEADEATPSDAATPPAPTATSTPPATSVKQLPTPTVTTRPPQAEAMPTPEPVVAAPPRPTSPDSSAGDAADQAEAGPENGMDADDGMADGEADDGMEDSMDSDGMADAAPLDEPDAADASDEAPSAEPPPATTFEDYERSPFVETSVDAVSTFSLDTDRASYFLALNWARNGHTVEPRSVRAEEWVNAFDYGYEQPHDDRSFALTTDVVRHPLSDGLHLARIAFQAPEFRDETPLNVTLVLDASGSMDTGNRVAIARAAAEAIRQSLGSDDRIAVMHFSTGVLDRFTVEHSAPDDQDIVSSISRLAAHDSTNVQAGLNLGVQLADAARRERPEAFNYIILMSDGVANVDATDPFAILESAADTDSRNPLRLITVGVGVENYNDVLLEQLAQHGNGWYRYLDDTAQAQATFSRENWVVLSTPFADQARAQVTWDPAVVKSWRIVGYENRVTPDHTFEQDRKEFAELPAGTATTAFYELELHEGAGLAQAVGSVEVRWVEPATGESRAQAAEVSGPAGVAFDSGDPPLRFGAIVGLAADRYSSLSAQVEGQPVDAAGVRADLAALQDELDTLAAHLGSTEAFRDFDFLLDALADAAEALAPSSGYSR